MTSDVHSIDLHCEVRTRQREGAADKRGDRAFARLEALALLGAIALLTLVALPLPAGNRLRSDRVVCANNLRQISAAMQLWANDHGDLFPQEVAVSDGGTSMHPLAVNVWLHFSWISNELGSAQVLFCPSDQGRPARDFSADPTGGYLNPNFANRSTSYLLSHARQFQPTDLLAADRNVGSDQATGCSRFRSARGVILQQPPPLSSRFEWTPELHNGGGNLLLFDGRVVEVPTGGLRAYYSPLAGEGPFHFIAPR